MLLFRAKDADSNSSSVEKNKLVFTVWKKTEVFCNIFKIYANTFTQIRKILTLPRCSLERKWSPNLF